MACLQRPRFDVGGFLSIFTLKFEEDSHHSAPICLCGQHHRDRPEGILLLRQTAVSIRRSFRKGRKEQRWHGRKRLLQDDLQLLQSKRQPQVRVGDMSAVAAGGCWGGVCFGSAGLSWYFRKYSACPLQQWTSHILQPAFVPIELRIQDLIPACG